MGDGAGEGIEAPLHEAGRFAAREGTLRIGGGDLHGRAARCAQQLRGASGSEQRAVGREGHGGGVVVQPLRELRDGDLPFGVEPRAVRPEVGLARHAQDTRGGDALEQCEVGVVGRHVVERRDVGLLLQ